MKKRNLFKIYYLNFGKIFILFLFLNKIYFKYIYSKLMMNKTKFKKNKKIKTEIITIKFNFIKKKLK